MRISVLDLGSNSFHVLVADADEGGALVPVLREREMLHLGTEVARHGHIPDAARREAVSVVTHLTELAKRAGVERHLAVATSALRDASNGPDVIAELKTATGTHVRVLDGIDEARLAYLGVRASVAVTADPTLVLDLGGGSLEFAVGSSTHVAWAATTDLGVSRLSAKIERDPIRAKDVAALEQRVDEGLRPVLGPVRGHAPETVVAVGGTVRALARVLAARTGRWLPATLNQFVIRPAELDELTAELQGLDAAGRAELPGMKSRRADRAHIAATVLRRTVERLGVDEVVVSDWGLREGAILRSVGFSDLPDAAQLRRGAIERVRETFSPDPDHAPHVAHLVMRVFEGTTDIHGLDATDRELLRDAALLHDIGESLALRRHHHHGAYLVEHAEMRGFSPAETAIVATLVRCHASRGIAKRYPAYAAMSDGDKDRTQRMLALLQVADALDRARDQAIEDLHFQRREGRLQVVLHGRGLHVARTEVERRTLLFARTFGIELEVVNRLGTGA